ncbi:MAG TPA: DUF1801 domain-containing protein [Anaerolineaceae bacterium]|nr:DUF1801 domain-containing protein [Anaerolineaceae bacterium]
MLTLSEIHSHYQHLPGDQLDILVEIHNLVAEIAPTATERLDRWGITYYHADRGGPVSAGICQMLVKGDHIHLAFIHGAFLPDPRGLLEGSTFPKRFMRLASYEDTDWDAIRALIEVHSNFDPRTLPQNQK